MLNEINNRNLDCKSFPEYSDREEWMEEADSQAFVEAISGMIDRAISQGRVSRQTVNQAVNNAETMIAAGQFTYEQKRLCQMYTMVTRQYIQQSKDRF